MISVQSHDIIILCALKEELSGIYTDIPTIFTGVGKVNATLAATRCALEDKPKLIINYGTAGSIKSDMKGLVEIGSAVQRDLDLRAFGSPMGGYLNQDKPNIVAWSSNGFSVGTGDSFSEEKPPVQCDLVDMEAYAIARVCQEFGIAFKCLKYISDAADSNAVNDWNKNVSCGSRLFQHWLEYNLKNHVLEKL